MDLGIGQLVDLVYGSALERAALLYTRDGATVAEPWFAFKGCCLLPRFSPLSQSS